MLDVNDTDNTTLKNTENSPDSFIDVSKELDSLFFGSFTHSVDSKGRVIVPSSFRTKLGDSFVITVTQNFDSLAIYTEKAFLKLYKKLQQGDDLDPAIYEYKKALFAWSYTNQQFDAQGRALLPMELRKIILKDAKDIKFTGIGEYIILKEQKEAEQGLLDFISNREQRYEEFRNAMLKCEQNNRS